MAAACADIFSNRSYEKFDLMGVWRKIYSEAVLKDWTSLKIYVFRADSWLFWANFRQNRGCQTGLI
jgi:hypothetical protein